MSVVADLRFGSPAQVVAMNKATWDALPPDLQRIVEQCSASFVKDGTRYREDAEVAAARKLQADPRYTFLPFSSQLYEEMQRVTVPVYENWKADMSRRGVDGERLLARTRELVKQFSATSARES
jgi:TRAP-type transport system periplasmic protein